MITSKRLLPALALVTALGLVATACGGDDDSAADGTGDGTGSAVPACLTFEDLYALSGPESEGFTNWSDAQNLATELGSPTELPDLPLEITAPGEESGTYGSYIEIALKAIAEARAEQEFITEDQIETTRKDYSSNPNDNVITEAIAGTEGSFGWVGFSFADQADGVRLLEIDGGDGGDGCVEPTPETIGDGSYPLARTLYIYVNTARAGENPALAAYIDLYMSDVGRQAVTDADYVELPEDQWNASVDAWEAVDGPAGDGGLVGEVVVSGSSTVEPISGIVAEVFAGENPDVAISVEGPGTSDGFAQFCAGETDVADASRPIKDEETRACADAGIEYVELAVAIDGLSVITQG